MENSLTYRTNRLAYLDCWRFLAVLMVIQAHVLIFSGVNLAWVEAYSLLLDRLSELGVLIFFGISGFVICRGLVQEHATTGKICLSAFYVRRACRILPPLWLYLCCLVILNAYGIIHITGQQALTSLFFLCNMPFPQECSWFAGHTWTLAYEEQFYLLFPGIFLWLAHSKPHQRLQVAIGCLLLISVYARFNQLKLLADFSMYFNFMLIGCYSALLPQDTLQRYANLPLGTWVLLPIVLILCMANLSKVAETYAKTCIYPILIPLMIFGTPLQYAWLRNFFQHRLTCYFGRISYSIYLWQELATSDYLPASLVRTLSYVLLVFLFSALSFRYFEQPLILKGAAWSKRLQSTMTLVRN